MKKNKLVFLAIAGLCISFAACSEQKTTNQEEIEIKTMDSTSKSVKETSDKLEEQTKKVEASLEKLDNEFQTP